MTQLPLSFASLLLLATGALAQVPDPRVAATPASFALEAEAPPVSLLAPPDVARLLAEDAERGPFPLRYGATQELDLDLEKAGRWDEAGNAWCWRAEVRSPGAHSLGVLLAQFGLPEGAALYAYDAARTTVLGPFTRQTEQPNGMLALAPVPGDRLVLELVLDKAARGTPLLSVDHVVHDYRDVFALARGSEDTEARGTGCLVDINCGQGAPYQDIKRSVVGLYRGGFACSGSILNNTAEDATPYMLTAEHCGSMTNAVVVFEYENATCNGGGASNSKSVSGATLLAASASFDSQLYLLNQAPPASYHPFYAGWDRSNNAQPKPGISISHPAGLPKKIAIDRQDPQDWGTQWAGIWEVGEILGGSSGSPFFNGEKRVIGPACCVSSFTCVNQTTFYGKLQRFWNNQSLAQWLDPLGTGAARIDGYGPFDPLATVTNGSGGNPEIYTSTLPELGASWTGTVDTSTLPSAVSTVLVAYEGGSSGSVFSFGELLVDLASPKLFQSTEPVSGGLSSHTATLPSDPALAGSVAHTQAVVLGGGPQATNGVVLTLN